MSNESKPSNELVIRRAANLPADSWSDERIRLVASTIAPPEAGPAEVAMFLAVAARYDLDPFAKEIWLAKDKGRLIILTGKDSILKVARSSPDYLGHESGVVYEGDEFLAHRQGGDVAISHSSSFERGAIKGAFCIARKRDHPPVLVMRAMADFEHLKGKDNWRNYPADMITARVVTAAHRLLYNISGMYTQEEVDSGDADTTPMRSIEVADKTRDRLEALKAQLGGPQPQPEPGDPPVVDAVVVEEKPAPRKTPPVPKDEPEAVKKRRFWAVYKEKGYDTDVSEQEARRREWLDSHFSVTSVGDLTPDQLDRAVKLLHSDLGPAPVATEEAATEEAAAGAGPGDGLPF